MLVLAGAASLILADGQSPWSSYWLLVATYSGMAVFDVALHGQHMTPPWLLRWKLAVSSLIVLSLLLGVLKGSYLERNAARLIQEAAFADE